jgi:hypothetical protein
VQQISNESVNMTGQGQAIPNEEQRMLPSTGLGGMRISAEARLIEQSVEQLAKVLLLEPHVRDAAIQKALLTTTTMTTLLQLLGSVSPATSSGTKN